MSTERPSGSAGSGDRTVWRALDNRLHLAGLEFLEARNRLGRRWAGTVAALMSLQLFLASLLVVVVALTWETSWRVAAPAIVAAVFGVIAAGVGWWTWRRWRDWRPFAETVRQLSQDLSVLEKEAVALMGGRQEPDPPAAEPDEGRDREGA